MRILPKNKNERLKITNLNTQKFLIKSNRSHCLSYFQNARLFNGEPLTYADIKNNQVFKFKNDTWLIEIITKSEADALKY